MSDIDTIRAALSYALPWSPWWDEIEAIWQNHNAERRDALVALSRLRERLEKQEAERFEFQLRLTASEQSRSTLREQLEAYTQRNLALVERLERSEEALRRIADADTGAMDLATRRIAREALAMETE